MLEASVLIAVIVGISQIVKNIGLPSKFIPLVNLALGVGLSFLFFTDITIKETVLQGLIVGLSASGLYDQTKKLSLGSNSSSKPDE